MGPLSVSDKLQKHIALLLPKKRRYTRSYWAICTGRTSWTFRGLLIKAQGNPVLDIGTPFTLW